MLDLFNYIPLSGIVASFLTAESKDTILLSLNETIFQLQTAKYRGYIKNNYLPLFNIML